MGVVVREEKQRRGRIVEGKGEVLCGRSVEEDCEDGSVDSSDAELGVEVWVTACVVACAVVKAREG